MGDGNSGLGGILPGTGIGSTVGPMHAVAQVVPPKGDADMARYEGAKMEAWRSRASHVLQVDIGVAATPHSKNKIEEGKYPSEVETGHVLVLKIVPDGSATSLRDQWSDSYLKQKSLPYTHVVLMDGGAVIAAATVQTMDGLEPPPARQVEKIEPVKSPEKAEPVKPPANAPYTQNLKGDSPETGIFALADMAKDCLKLQVASMNYNDIFVRYTRALDQRAQARSEKEVRSMTHAARVLAEASKTSARATVASVIVAIVALVVALLSHGK